VETHLQSSGIQRRPRQRINRVFFIFLFVHGCQPLYGRDLATDFIIIYTNKAIPLQACAGP
jgi:hypothetical protein